MRYLAAVAASAAALAACGSGNTPKPDASNIFHCGVAFAVARGIASTGNDAEAARAERYFDIMANYTVPRVRKMPARERSQSELHELGRLMTQNGDVHGEMMKACIQRTVSEPEFAAYYAGLPEEVRRSLRR